MCSGAARVRALQLHCATTMTIQHARQAYEYFRPRISTEVEEFWIATLDAGKRVTASRCLFRGTVDHCLFHPRDVFRFACLANASSFLVAHNHPSGDPRPSEHDSTITDQLLTLAALMQIPFVDHVILAGDRYFSFMEGRKISRSDEPCDQ